MNRLKVNFPFFLWFITFTLQKGLNNVCTLPSINVKTSVAKVWHLANGIGMVSVHAPTHQPIKIFAKEKTVHAFPYESGREGMDTDTVQLGDIKKVHEQANYANAIWNAIAE